MSALDDIVKYFADHDYAELTSMENDKLVTNGKQAAAELAQLRADLAAVVKALRGTAKHQLPDMSICWCEKYVSDVPTDYGHSFWCQQRRELLARLDKPAA